MSRWSGNAAAESSSKLLQMAGGAWDSSRSEPLAHRMKRHISNQQRCCNGVHKEENLEGSVSVCLSAPFA